MRLCFRGWIAAALLAAPMTSLAVTCTTQAALQNSDRAVLAAVGQRLTDAILQQNYATLQAQLLPAISSQWDGMRGEIELGAPLLKGGQAQLQSIYLLDASAQTETTDDQFFCSNASGSLTVTITMHALPPGKYAVILAQAAGAPLGGQIGLIVVWDPTATPAAWKLGGVSVRQGSIDGHDGVWYWTRARSLKREPVSPGARGTATTWRGICCCRWIFCRRRTWRSWAASNRRSRIRRVDFRSR